MCLVYHGYKPSNNFEIYTDVSFVIIMPNTCQQMIYAFIDFFGLHTVRPQKLMTILFPFWSTTDFTLVLIRIYEKSPDYILVSVIQSMRETINVRAAGIFFQVKIDSQINMSFLKSGFTTFWITINFTVFQTESKDFDFLTNISLWRNLANLAL